MGGGCCCWLLVSSRSARKRRRPARPRPYPRSRTRPRDSTSRTASSRSTGTVPTARSGWRSRRSTRNCSTTRRCRPAWARTTSASIAASSARRTSSASSASGKKVLLVEPNYAFRATSDNADERRAVTEAFATSVLWGFEAAAETDGRVLVDATAFILRDAHDVVRSLKPAELQPRRVAERGEPGAHQGVPAQHRARRDPDVHRQRRQVYQTGGGLPGGRVPDVAPTRDGRHRAAAPLASCGCRSRATSRCAFDPRAGASASSYADFAAPIGRAADQALHRRGIGCASRIRRRRSATLSSRSSTTSIAARRSRSARRCSTARAGGRRRSKPPATATPSASS